MRWLGAGRWVAVFMLKVKRLEVLRFHRLFQFINQLSFARRSITTTGVSKCFFRIRRYCSKELRNRQWGKSAPRERTKRQMPIRSSPSPSGSDSLRLLLHLWNVSVGREPRLASGSVARLGVNSFHQRRLSFAQKDPRRVREKKRSVRLPMVTPKDCAVPAEISQKSLRSLPAHVTNSASCKNTKGTFTCGASTSERPPHHPTPPSPNCQVKVLRMHPQGV